jgi:hypothetical protein
MAPVAALDRPAAGMTPADGMRAMRATPPTVPARFLIDVESDRPHHSVH